MSRKPVASSVAKKRSGEQAELKNRPDKDGQPLQKTYVARPIHNSWNFDRLNMTFAPDDVEKAPPTTWIRLEVALESTWKEWSLGRWDYLISPSVRVTRKSGDTTDYLCPNITEITLNNLLSTVIFNADKFDSVRGSFTACLSWKGFIEPLKLERPAGVKAGNWREAFCLLQPRMYSQSDYYRHRELLATDAQLCMHPGCVKNATKFYQLKRCYTDRTELLAPNDSVVSWRWFCGEHTRRATGAGDDTAENMIEAPRPLASLFA